MLFVLFILLIGTALSCLVVYHHIEIQRYIESKISRETNSIIIRLFRKYKLVIHAFNVYDSKTEFMTQKDNNIYVLWYEKKNLQWPIPTICFQIKSKDGFKIKIMESKKELEKYIAAIASNQVLSLPLANIVDIKAQKESSDPSS